MRRFAHLCLALDTRTSEADRLDALRAYFDAVAPHAPADAAWALHLLAGATLRPVLGAATRQATLRAAACAASGLPDWLVDACCDATGDLAEAIALLLPPPTRPSEAGLTEWIETRLPTLQALPSPQQPAWLASAWDELDAPARQLLIQLIGAGWCLRVDAPLLQRALAAHSGLDAALIAQRLLGWADARTPPTAARWRTVISHPETAALRGDPFPWVADQPLDAAPPDTALGGATHWIGWAYGGLRAQLVRRAGRAWLWTDGGRLLNDHFPELIATAAALPDGSALDGELLIWPPGAPGPAPVAQLQRRLARAAPGAALRAATPPRFIAQDLLSLGGEDQRARPWWERRAALEALLAPASATEAAVLAAAELLDAADAAALTALRQRARLLGLAGLRLGRRDAGHGEPPVGFWPLAPQVVQAVLLYAQSRPGARGSSSGEYTFAVWNRPPVDAAEAQAVAEAIARREPPQPGGLQLLPIARVDAPADALQAEALSRALRNHTLQKFGPVRALRPTLVAELGFDGVAASVRHKSGLALQQPRLLGLHEGRPLEALGDLLTLRALLPAGPPG